MSTELDQLLEPKPVEPQPQGETLEQKVGRVLNENADLARRYQELEARVASQSQPKQPEPTRDENDKGWSEWAGKVRREAGDDQTWMTDPGSAVEKAIKIAGKDLTDHVTKISRQEALNAAGAMRADMEFSSYYPDLMGTEMGSEAVRRAILQVRGDAKFQQALSRPATRPRAFQMIAKAAKAMIPGSPCVRRNGRADHGGRAHTAGRGRGPEADRVDDRQFEREEDTIVVLQMGRIGTIMSPMTPRGGVGDATAQYRPAGVVVC
jgi:hypothetical protein